MLRSVAKKELNRWKGVRDDQGVNRKGRGAKSRAGSCRRTAGHRVGGRARRTDPCGHAVDAIISAPVLKTHDQGQVALALKNLKGLVINGDKRRIHQIGMFDGAVDLVSHFKPVFAVVDAIIGQEGMRPLLGISVDMGLVAAGRDLMAVDAIAGRIMGFAPEEMPITVTAANRGLGTMTEAKIEVTGEPGASVARRFVRAEKDHRIDAEGINILHSEGTCTGCRNGLLSSLFDLRADGSLARARDLSVVAGPTPLPAGIPQEFLVGIGSCALPEAKGLSNYVKGCPPNNVDIIRALTAEWIGEG